MVVSAVRYTEPTSILSSWWINLSPTSITALLFRGSTGVGLVAKAVKLPLSSSKHFLWFVLIIVVDFSYVHKVVYPAWAVVIAATLFEILTQINVQYCRDDDFRVLFGDGGRLSTSELNCILSYFASSRS